MNDLLSTRQVQDILKVDRITVYRMLNDKRLTGVKIGTQWRFERATVERLLGRAIEAAQPADSSFPTDCVQTIQDLFSEVSQLSAVVLDPRGEPLTQVSRPCLFCQVMQSTPGGREASRACFAEFARKGASADGVLICHAGLQYLAAPVMANGEITCLFLIGPFNWQEPDPQAQTELLARLSAAYALPVEALRQAAGTVPVISAGQHERLRAWPAAAAKAVQHILQERTGFMNRLQQIATLTQVS